MVEVDALLPWREGTATSTGCHCQPSFADDVLEIDAKDCPEGGRLATAPACRATAIDALTDRDAAAVRTRRNGTERAYEGEAAALLSAAGRFADAVAVHDDRLAHRTRKEPLAATREALGRAGPVADLVESTGLARWGTVDVGIEAALTPHVGPTMSHWRVEPKPPTDGVLAVVRELGTDATARVYERPGQATRRYHLDPVDTALERAATTTLAAAHERLATGTVAGGERAAGRAVRAVADEDDPLPALTEVLRKHTRGYGLLEDLFSDPDLSDVYVTAPAAENPLRVRVNGETMASNVRLTAAGVSALASRFRRVSGRAFSRAAPTLDAGVGIQSRQVRVAGVTEPASPGIGFAFRAHDRTVWTLPALVENDTLSASAAALLSLAVERGASVLIAGPRGAGKTTLLGALLWELPADVRTVCLEDAPELPITQLQSAGRDVQALRAAADGDGISPVEGLRASLRLGDGALVVGEVRGEEAGVLYEAMRVGANSEAVLGTIHGDGGAAVFERVVSDLGVPPSAFAATDLLVTCATSETETGTERRVRSIEEVLRPEAEGFEALFARDGGGLSGTGCIDRGNSDLLANLAQPDESYAAVRSALRERREAICRRSSMDQPTRDDAGARPTARGVE